MQTTTQLIHSYYQQFNEKNMSAFLDLLSENVVHDINQGKSEVGKTAFADFLQHMNECYDENIQDLIIMVDASGRFASSRFMVHGQYLKTDGKFPRAHGQTYTLPAVGYFEIEENKISRVATYYNLPDWVHQVNTQS